MGLASRNKLRVEVAYVTFKRVADGAPAQVDWLCDQGCTDFKYDFQAGAGSDDLEHE